MVTVREIIKLDKFNQFRLVAGESGLDNLVIRGGIIDYESIENLKQDNLEKEMLLSNLPMIKNQPELIFSYIAELIESKVACFAVKTSLFKEIPREAIDLANQHEFPIFLFDEFFLDKLVIDIDRFVDSEHQLYRKKAIINQMLDNQFDEDKIKRLTNDFNKYFLDCLMVCYVKNTVKNKLAFDVDLAQKLLGQSATVVPIDEVYAIFYSSEQNEINKNVIVHKLGLKSENYHIGVSSSTSNHALMGQLINESILALKYSLYKDEFLNSYEDLGIYQLLMPTLSSPQLVKFHTSIISKILAYDEKHQSQLLETAIAYVHSDANIKETAATLYQHENTIRFRIRKIKEIVDFDAFKGAKYETFALAIHLHQLEKIKI